MADKTSVIVKEGYLIKSPPPDKLMANWHKRYFVLWSSGYMEYYSSNEKRPHDYLKTIDLTGCEDMVAPFPIGGRTFIIKIAIVNKGKNRDYFLDCESQSVMDEWISELAEVCGFTAVDCEVEQDNYFEVVSSSTPPPPLPTAPKPHIPDTMPSLINRPKLRPPLPPPKPTTMNPSTPDSGEIALYEHPDLVQFIEEDTYEGEISHSVLQALNQKPPPIWKNPANSVPPPLPPNRQSRRFTRSLGRRQSGALDGSEDLPTNSSPPLPDRSLSEEFPTGGKKAKHKNLPPLPRQKPKPPPPPVKNRACTPPISPEFTADLSSKLKQRTHNTWSGDDQMPYEELVLSRVSSPTSNESDTGSYVECEPQEYLDYHHASAFLGESPTRQPPREKLPLPLPPRDPSPHTSPPPLPARANSTPISSSEDESAPPVPRRHPHASGRALSQANQSTKHSNITTNPLPLPPRVKSPSHGSNDKAPPLPTRGVEMTRSFSDNGEPPPIPPQRGISTPRGGTRLPIPPPKMAMDNKSKDANIFEEINFDRKHIISNESSSVSREHKQGLQHSNARQRPDIVTEQSSIRSPFHKPSRPPITPPKREVSPGHDPWLKTKPNISSKPKVNLSPPPVASKPGALRKSSSDDLLSNSGSGRQQFHRDIDSRKKLPTPPVSPSRRPKLPDPPSHNNIESRKKLPDPPVHENRGKLPDHSFLNSGERGDIPPNSLFKGARKPPPADTRRKSPKPQASNGPEVPRKPQTFNGPEVPRKPQTSNGPKVPRKPQTYNGPEVPRKPQTFNGPEVSRKPQLPSDSRQFNSPGLTNGPETAKKPPSGIKVKSVLSKLQNSDLEACLRNNDSPPYRTGGVSSSNQAPAVLIKPKPMLPPR